MVALVANQDSGSIVVLREGREAAPLTNGDAIPTPVCLCLPTCREVSP